MIASDQGQTVHLFTCLMQNTNILGIYDNTRMQTLRKTCCCVCARGLTDETEILKFLQHGTLVGLLPVPHPILIRKYQANSGTTMWFRTYLWGVIYLRSAATFLVCPVRRDGELSGGLCSLVGVRFELYVHEGCHCAEGNSWWMKLHWY